MFSRLLSKPHSIAKLLTGRIKKIEVSIFSFDSFWMKMAIKIPKEDNMRSMKVVPNLISETTKPCTEIKKVITNKPIRPILEII